MSNVKSLIGCTLDSVLNMEDSSNTFYIGSSSGYFFIGTLTKANEMIDGISKKCYDDFLRRRDLLKKERHDILEKVKNDGMKYDGKKENLFDYADRIQRMAKQIKQNVNSLDIAKIRVDTFIPMREREIKDAYYKIDNENEIALILGGMETGKYWMKEEWERDHADKKV